MDHELVGVGGRGDRRGRWRPVAALPCALAAFALALIPVRPGWLWPVLVVAAACGPWVLGFFAARRARPYWRLSAAGLERIGPDGTAVTRYERARIEELALTDDDGMLTIFHKFGRTQAGELAEMGFEVLPFFITARRLGIPLHVLDGDHDVLDDDDEPPPGTDAEQRLLDLEAGLLAAVLESREAVAAEPVRLESAPPVPSRRRIALVGVLPPLLALGMLVRLGTAPDLGNRIAAGCWALVGITGALVAHRRLLRTTPIRWLITASALEARVGRRVISAAASDVVALFIGRGAVLAFDHRLQLLTRLPSRGVDAFQLMHALDEHGYQVFTAEPPVLRPSEYGLDGLPEIFAQVPGGRLVVVDDGLGWADAAGDVVLKMPTDRIGGVELLTIDGHAWLRVYDSDGDEFFAAPLTALRISRTDLREQARRMGLPVTDAEYDAYLSAAFHGTVSGLSAIPSPDDPEPAALPLPAPAAGPSSLLDVTRRSRLWGLAVTVGVCEIVAVLGAMWLAADLGGFGTALAWAAPTGLLLGVGGAWLYDRNRSQLRISAREIASVTRLGRVEWRLGRETVGGIGIDESEEGAPRLVVWSPRGRVLRRVAFPPDLAELRRACERYGLPWGPPDAGLPTPPPPEL